MIIYTCKDLDAVEMNHPRCNNQFVYDENDNCMITTYQLSQLDIIRPPKLDCYDRKFLQQLTLRSGAKYSTHNYYHKGYVTLEDDMRDLFEEYADLKDYVQVPESDAKLYRWDDTKYIELYNEDHYPRGRVIIPKTVKGKSLIAYLYNYSNELLKWCHRSSIIEAIVANDFDAECLQEYDLSVLEDKEYQSNIINIAKAISEEINIREVTSNQILDARNKYRDTLITLLD